MFDEDINTFGYCNADEEQAQSALRLRPLDPGARGDRARSPVLAALRVRAAEAAPLQTPPQSGPPRRSRRRSGAKGTTRTGPTGRGIATTGTDRDSWIRLPVVIEPMLEDYQHARYPLFRINIS